MKHLMTLLGVCSLLFLFVVSAAAQEAIDESSLYANSWAVIIGINDYQNISPLEYAVNDAKAIETRFRSMGFNVVALYNEQATKANIMNKLKHELPLEVSSEDRLVIFYAGHGAAGVLPTGEEVGFIIPVDAQLTIDGRELDIFGERIQVEDYETFAEKTNFISVDELREVYDSVNAKHILYIIDGCYSGFLDPAVYSRLHPSRRITQMARLNNTSRSLIIDKNKNTPQPATPQNTAPTGNRNDYLRVMASRDTVQVLTAGSSGEVVFEKSGHGVFTYYLLRALDGAADVSDDPRSPVGDCVVTATELGDYLKRKVPEASNSSQMPLFNRINGEGEFLFIPPICKPIDPIDQQEPLADKEWAKTDAYQGPKGSHYKQPTQVLVDNENQVYVLDRELRHIFKFDAEGNYVSTQLEEPGIDLKRWSPSSMALGTSGEIWVYYAWDGKKPKDAPQVAGQIVIYASDGTLMPGWTGSTDPLISCESPSGAEIFPFKGLIAIDIEGNLVVVDQESGLMRKCDRNGKVIKEWGKYEEHKIIENINKYKTVRNPQGLAVDLFGYIYVADTEGNGIQKYFDGEWIPSWPNVKGNKPYFFDSPHGLAVDSKAYIYVADTNNHRIKKYTSRGEKLLTYWGKKNADNGSKYGEFDEPWGVAVNGDSSLVYVADTGNKRVQKFIIRR